MMRLSDWQVARANVQARAAGLHLRPTDACSCGALGDNAAVGMQRDSLGRPMVAWFCRCGRRRSDWLPKSAGIGRDLPEWIAAEHRWLDERFEQKVGNDD